jgi:site-specific recombinase XerD
VSDIDLDSGILRVIKGKGSWDRIAYISRECVKIISEYLRDYPRDEGEFLVTTVIRNNQYKSTDLRKTVNVIAKRAKIKKRVHPHLFRHSLAVNLLQRGANIMSIQQILGHQSLQSTLIYAHSVPQKVQSEYQFFAPNYF